MEVGTGGNLGLSSEYHKELQYRHLIPAPVDRTSTSAWLYKDPWITYQKNKLNKPMTHVDCKSKYVQL